MQNLRRGFTLLEMVMVLAVSGLMVGFLLQDRTPKISVAECTLATKTQLNYIRARLEAFARDNERLPLPAKRYVNPTDSTYGREAAGADITQAAGVSFGALPFQVLGLNSSYAGDCWGNKFTYAVTTALTTDSSSGGYMDSAVEGNITLLGDGGRTVDTEIAYAVISHGEDALGAVKLAYTNSSAPPDTSWCTGSTNIAYTNCLATAATLQEGTINNGKDAGANYFDDLIVYAGKPKVITTATNTLFCWGRNNSSQLGDGTTTDRHVPTPVNTALVFTQVSEGSTHACGLTITGEAYCWGSSTYGALGDGSSTVASSPVPVSGGLTFRQISAGDQVTCGITTSNDAYCWGYRAGGMIGDGIIWPSWGFFTPQAVTGGLKFRFINLGYNAVCGIIADTPVGDENEAYCWGWNDHGTVGDGTKTQRWAPVAVSGGLKFRVIQQNSKNTCGLTTDSEVYCWGDDNQYQQLGTPYPATTESLTPRKIDGTDTFEALTFNGITACGLNSAGASYCWGASAGTGNGNLYTIYSSPTPTSGGYVFRDIYASHYTGICGITTTQETYCWGSNTYGEAGNDSANAVGEATPVAVSTTSPSPSSFGSLGTGAAGNYVCGVAPPPAVGWGDNTFGQVGDGTTTNQTNPIYMTTTPSGVGFVKVVGFYYNKCALGTDGKAYCWGQNDCGQVGDGTRTATNTPKAVPFPTGVTSWKDISMNSKQVCAIGNDDKPYCWGSNSSCSGVVQTPTLRSVPSTTVKKIHLTGDDNNGTVVGSNDVPYVLDPDTSYSTLTLPGVMTTVKDVWQGSTNTCILGSDDQIYCLGCTSWASGNANCTNGDGAVAASNSSATFVSVTNPPGPPVTSWKALAMGDTGGGWSFMCGIGNDDQLYCWGRCENYAMCGNGSDTLTQTTPTAVTKPSGVTGWKSVDIGNGMMIALGNDGVYYFSGWFAAAGMSGLAGNWGSNSMTAVPLPPGAANYRSVSASGWVAIID